MRKKIYIITLGDDSFTRGIELCHILHDSSLYELVSCHLCYERSLKSYLREANRLGASIVVIIGEEELKKNIYTIKDMKRGIQYQSSNPLETIFDIFEPQLKKVEKYEWRDL